MSADAPPIRRLFVRLLVVALLGLVSAELVGALGGLWLQDRQTMALHASLVDDKLDLAAARLAPLSGEARQRALFDLDRALAVRLVLLPEGAPDHAPMRTLPDGARLHALPGVRPPPPLGAIAARLLLTLVVVAIILAVVGRPLVRDLLRLERVAVRLGGGDLGARAGLDGGPVARLGARFDAMAARIEALLTGQRRLLEAVSHELRTPQARMRFQLEAARDAEPAARARLLDELDEELDQVDELLGDLLTTLRLEQPPTEPADPEESAAVVAACVARLQTLSPHPIEADLDGELAIGAKDLRRIVENLLTNAARHATGRIRVTLRPGRLDVDDDGPGVPVSERARIFEPFASGDPSRARALGGVGLGLALVERSAARWGAAVTVGESAMGGARFTVVIGRK